MNKSDALKRINKAMNGENVDFSSFDAEVQKLKQRLEETVTIKNPDDVSRALNQMKKSFDISPILTEVGKLKNGLEAKIREISSEIATVSDSRNIARVAELKSTLSSLESELRVFESSHFKDLESLGKEITGLKISLMESVSKSLESLSTKSEVKSVLSEAQGLIDELRKELIKRISSLGGGSMNRQIFIGGVDPLTRYTDINLKAGSNVTLTYANNNTTKKVDVTISATGGSGSGIVRSINSIAVDTAAGSSSTTDYVYLCSGTLTLTLPDASTNSNLYTVKNVGAGIVTVNTTSAQTIDGSLTITLPTRYTSVDISSDTANWNVT